MPDIVRISPGTRMSQVVCYSGLLITSGLVDSQAADVAGQMRNVLAKFDALLAQALIAALAS